MTLNKIVVEDYEGWSRSNSASSSGSMVKDKIEINERVKVTFHRMWGFLDTFSEFYQDFKEIEESLNPKYNQ